MYSKLNRLVVAMALLAMWSGSVAQAGKARDETRFRARLTAERGAGDVSGQVDFKQRSRRRQFSVEIEGLTAGRLFDVMVAGKVVGTVLIDDLGVGELDFDDRADPDDLDEPFPPGFPAINGGELVEVGPLSGTVQPK